MITPSLRRIALLVAGCFFMEMLDTTIVTTSSRPLAAALGVTPDATAFVVSAFMIALAVGIPASGWLAGRYGTRPVLLSAIALFTAASLGCGVSGSLGMLVGMRVVQGLGAAMMVPVGRQLILRHTAKPDLPKMMSYVIWPGLIAPVLAPVVGGALTTYISWRAMFLINIPLGVAALGVGLRIVPADREPGAPPPLDGIGLVLSALGLGGLTATGGLAALRHPPTVVILAALAGSIAALALCVAHLRRSPHPLVSLEPLRHATFRMGIRSGTGFWLAMATVPFLLPLLLAAALGLNPVQSGAVVLFVFAGNIAAKPTTTAIIHRLGFRRMLIAAALVLAASIAAFALVGRGTPLVLVATIAFVGGAARSIGATVLTTMPFAEITGGAIRHANTLAAAAQQAGSGLGVTVAAVALHLAGDALGSDPGQLAALHVAFLVSAAFALLTAVGAWALPRDAGDVIRSVSAAARSSAGSAAPSARR